MVTCTPLFGTALQEHAIAMGKCTPLQHGQRTLGRDWRRQLCNMGICSLTAPNWSPTIGHFLSEITWAVIIILYDDLNLRLDTHGRN